MEQRHLGRTGLRVSRIGLGTLTWGRDTDEHDAADLLKGFWEAGGTLVDTADVYGDGEAEYLLGQLMEGLVPRRDLVISTKAGSVPDPDRRFDGSRGHLLSALDASLARLGTDYVDLWQIHAFDPGAPLEETLQALDIAVSSGRARYAGVSNFCGWQLAKAATWQLAAPGIRTRLASTQMEYSLLQRGVEREVLPAALDLGIGLLPSSPLGAGCPDGQVPARHARGLAGRVGTAGAVRRAVPGRRGEQHRGRGGDGRGRPRGDAAPGGPRVGPRPARRGRPDHRRAQRAAAHGRVVSGDP
jgi:aryl-alcohol dehydrogenase-like predicted oxidoreductase